MAVLALMRAVLGWIVGVALLAPPSATFAQSGGVSPLYHGILEVRRSRGLIHPQTGSAKLKVSGWTLRTSGDSNGVSPDREPILIAIGEQTFRLQSGDLKASARGRRFSYRAPSEVRRGVRSLRMRARRDGSYRLTLKLFDLDLSRLILNSPSCVPMAIIIGDDDGFSGAIFDRRSVANSRLTVVGPCTPEEDWEWLERCGVGTDGC